MLARLRSRRPSHATVVAYLALFVALGGTGAYAANTVFSTDIVDGEVKNQDLANNSVGQAKISGGGVGSTDLADNSVTSAKVTNDTASNGGLGAVDLRPSSVGASEVEDNSLTGSDLQEFTLSKVPDADQLDGLDSSQLLQGAGEMRHHRSDISPNTSDTFNIGLGNIQLQCNASGQYALFYYQQSATTGGMDVWWKNLDGVGYQRTVNLGGAAPLTPFTTRADIVTVQTNWTADWTPSELAVISVRSDATANTCVAAIRSFWTFQ
jgi:hypothetical protein